MKGLLIKDLNILLLQCRFIIIMVLGIAFLMTVTMDNPSFLIAYLTMLCSMLALTTISYDELDNGYTFLFTLPITRKDYVLAKYIMAVLVGGLAWLLSTVVCIAVSVARIEQYAIGEGILEAVLVLGICMSLLFIMIPVQLKFGSEKSRIVLFAIAGVVFVGAYLFDYVMEKINGEVSLWMEGMLHKISELSLVVLGMGVVAIMLVVIVISILVSVRVVEKKEF